MIFAFKELILFDNLRSVLGKLYLTAGIIQPSYIEVSIICASTGVHTYLIFQAGVFLGNLLLTWVFPYIICI